MNWRPLRRPAPTPTRPERPPAASEPGEGAAVKPSETVVSPSAGWPCWLGERAGALGVEEGLVFFFSPSDLQAKVAPGQRLRLGGWSRPAASRGRPMGWKVFRVTDGAATCG